jgi:hypothetical protein
MHIDCLPVMGSFLFENTLIKELNYCKVSLLLDVIVATGFNLQNHQALHNFACSCLGSNLQVASGTKKF